MTDDAADQKVVIQRVMMGAMLTVLFPVSLLGGFLIVSATITWLDGKIDLIPFVGVSLLLLLPVLGFFVGRKLFRQLEDGYTRRIRRRLIEFYLSTLAGVYLFGISANVTVNEQEFSVAPHQASWLLILGLIPLLIVLFTKPDWDDYEAALRLKRKGDLRIKTNDGLRVASEEDLRLKPGEVVRSGAETVARHSSGEK